VLARVKATATRSATVFKNNDVSAGKGLDFCDKSANVFRKNYVSASRGSVYCDKKY